MKCENLSCGRMGLVLAILSAIFYALSQGAANLLTNSTTPEVILITRYFLHAIPLVPILLYKPEKLVFDNKWNYVLVILGGLFKGLESLSTYYSYEFIPLLDSMVLNNSQPIFVAIISFFWLKESVGIHEIFTLVITLVGVVLVCEPSFLFGMNTNNDISTYSRLIGSIIAIASAIYIALCTCITRRLFDVDLYVIIYAQGIMSVLVGLILGIITNTLVLPTNTWDIIIMILVGVLGMLSRVFITQSLKTEDATIVSVLMCIRIPLMFAFQWAIIGTQPSNLATLGAILVTLSSILLSLKNQIKKLLKKPIKKIKATLCCGRTVYEEEEEEDALLNQSAAEIRDAENNKRRLESFYTSLEVT